MVRQVSHSRVEAALRKDLAEHWGLPMDLYRCHVESVYDHDPGLLRFAVFYRVDNGAAVEISDIYTDRQGRPVQHARPELTGLPSSLIADYEAVRLAPDTSV